VPSSMALKIPGRPTPSNLARREREVSRTVMGKSFGNGPSRRARRAVDAFLPA
jgi:hypothetical protein